ncbi:WD40 repeat-like protein [Punctularia strigosozonata HHB-11173 SS5]|uniref:WD40 repeat-like protein n=1 Tax=Punctularia strigosozonata (strain HHB-11173) TaxID=741275 RepID=UPI0004416494|nr:WD40 repeat-like protein [Punctularia strigosozonata HHB-11173 SS5]EIN08951.1 WD40 repeat-like protein [Punctularia strigosozonata HHB-11173 SS5]
MIQTGLLQDAHNDLITDASYDFYGLRLATAGLDQRVKIWSLDELTGKWTIAHEWKAHDAPVSKLSWAHPEFGSILASASFDRTVKVWEETVVPGDADQPSQSQQSQATEPASQGSQNDYNDGAAEPYVVLNTRWIERAILHDAKGTVRGVEFAPSYFGLKLATISSDNNLRIYEAVEEPAGPSQPTNVPTRTWSLSEELDVTLLPSSPSAKTISLTHTLSPTPTQTQTSMAGANATAQATLLQQELHAQQEKEQEREKKRGGNREADGGWTLSWCKDRHWGELIAAAVGTSGIVKIIHLSPSRRPQTLLILDPSSPSTSGQQRTTAAPNNPLGFINGHSRATDSTATSDETTKLSVTSVSWAPSCGRSYHLIATGSLGGHVRIWKVKPPADSEGEGANGGVSREDDGWTGEMVAEFDDHQSPVTRVEWNITGTILSSAGNDGRIRLWKATFSDVWRAAGHINVEQAPEHDDDEDTGEGDGDKGDDVDMEG